MNKRIGIFALLFIIIGFSAYGQQVPKRILVEHFTNTYCSVCASRNPGFYDLLSNFPDVQHIAFYPSSPYPACPLNQQNKIENDARANHYGVYGETPRLVINGEVIPVNVDYGGPSLFDPYQNMTSSFDLKVTLKQMNNTTWAVTVTLKKVDTSSLTDLSLYTLIAEDTLNFAANNGETIHHDVFRKSFTGVSPISIVAPLNVGDSVVLTQSITKDGGWNMEQCYAVAILSKSDKTVEQTARSGKIIDENTSIGFIGSKKMYAIFPIPVDNLLTIKGDLHQPVHAKIFGITGKLLMERALSDRDNNLDVSMLSTGLYLLYIQNENRIEVFKFNKK